MAILGIQINKKNPEYTNNDFLFWMPQFQNIENLDTLYDNLYPIANEKIFYSVCKRGKKKNEISVHKSIKR